MTHVPYAPMRMLMHKSGLNVEEEALRKLTEFLAAKVKKIASNALEKAKDAACANVWIEDVQYIIERDYRTLFKDIELSKVRAHFMPVTPMRDLMKDEGCVMPETVAIVLTSIFEEFAKILVKKIMDLLKPGQIRNKVTHQDIEKVIRDVFQENL